MKIHSLWQRLLPLLAAMGCFVAAQTQPQRSVAPAPDRRADEGEGPFDRFVIRGATIIDGTGAIRLSDQTNTPECVGGIKYTIKDGIIYDAKKLLSDVEKIVEVAKKQAQARCVNKFSLR